MVCHIFLACVVIVISTLCRGQSQCRTASGKAVLDCAGTSVLDNRNTHCCQGTSDDRTLRFCCNQTEWDKRQPKPPTQNPCGLWCLFGIFAGCLILVTVCGYSLQLCKMDDEMNETALLKNGVSKRSESRGGIDSIAFVTSPSDPGSSSCSNNLAAPASSQTAYVSCHTSFL